MMKIFLLSIIFLSFALCNKQQRILLISLDGFRHDYIERHNMTNYKNLISGGIRAKYLVPRFSTQTFPNHWSIVTGMYEESHGMIANRFYDPVYNETFVRSDINLKWWNATEPIWFSAVRQNLKAGTYFWPGSEVIYFNTSLYRKFKYDETVDFKVKVDEVVNWFTQENYTFACMYDNHPDTEGHLYGIDSPQFYQAVSNIDNNIAYLTTKLRDAKLLDSEDFNLIILSDHGMSNINKIIILDDYITLNDAIVTSIGGNLVHLNLYPNSNVTDLLNKLNMVPDVKIYLKKDIPDRWFYKNNKRIGDILVVANEGIGLYCFLNNPTAPRTFSKSDHGHDNNIMNLQAHLTARGPLFKKNYQSKNAIQNVDVYPLICYILKIKCLPNNGTLDNALEFLAENNSNRINFSLSSLTILIFIKFLL